MLMVVPFVWVEVVILVETLLCHIYNTLRHFVSYVFVFYFVLPNKVIFKDKCYYLESVNKIFEVVVDWIIFSVDLKLDLVF